METIAHGIGVTNRFELFYDEDVDPIEILKQKEEEKQKKKVEKHQKEKKATKVGKVATTTTKNHSENAIAKPAVKDVEVPKARPRQNDRPPRSTGSFPDSKEAEKNTRNKDDAFFNPDREGEFRRGRGGYRGRGGRDRGRGFYPNSENRPRRTFDRHSGSDKTGVRATDKRDGAGSNNWGDIRSDIAQRADEARWEDFDAKGDRTQEVNNWGEDEATETTAKSGEGDEKTGGETLDSSDTKENDQTDEQIQEAVKEMTLDEYKREQESKKVVHKFNIRKPGEGEDQKQWKKGYMLKKKVDEEEQDEEEEEEEEFAKKQQKVLLDFQFNFTDSRRGMRGRGRGGRGGPRGAGRDNANQGPRDDHREVRGGRGGGPRGKSGQQSAPRVDDFNDFPSLNTA